MKLDIIFISDIVSSVVTLENERGIYLKLLAIISECSFEFYLKNDGKLQR